MTQPQQSQRPMRTVPVWPGLSAIVDTVISVPPQPAEAVCDGDGWRDDEPEVGSADRLHSKGRDYRDLAACDDAE